MARPGDPLHQGLVALSRIDTASPTLDFSCVPGVGTRNRCVFRLMSMPSPRFGVGVLAGESAGFAPGAAEPLWVRLRDRGRITQWMPGTKRTHKLLDCDYLP